MNYEIVIPVLLSFRSVCPTFNRFKNGITIGPKIALIAKEIKTGITIS